MEFRVLGPLDARAAGHSVDLGRPKQRAVLAVLLLSANQVVSLDRLIELLWGDDAPARATGALQAYVSNLRRVLEPGRVARAPASVLVTQPPGYVLRVGPDQLDSARFESLARRGHRLLVAGRPRAAREVLTEALALWRGPALAEFSFDAFAQAEAARLEERRAVVMEDRLEAELALGNHAQVAGELEVAVGERPLRERLWSLLILALYRSGRQGEALRAYARVRAVLGEELGIEPSPALRRLEADVLAQTPGLDWRPPDEEPDEPPPTEVAGRSVPPASPAAAAVLPESRRPAPAPERLPLVGREAELGTVATSLEGARERRGRVVLISGEPGIGKTRLVEELTERARRDGALVAWGRAYQGEGAPPFWPWVQVVRELLAIGDAGPLGAALAPVARRVADLVPEVDGLGADVAAPPPLGAASTRFELCQAVTEFLLKLASSQPVVVVLDDVHWADPSSLQLLEFVGARVAGHLLVACAYRDVDPLPSETLTTTLALLARQSRVDRIDLKGLDAASAGAFMARTTGVDFAPDVTTAVHARASGNPFFIAELARLIAAEGDQAAADASRNGVPAAVRDVIRSGLTRLPEDTNALLAIASAAGRDFDIRVVAAVNGVDGEDALQVVDAAVAGGVLKEDDGAIGCYRFTHPIVQETIYAELPGLRRALVHARMAQVLEDLPQSEARRAELVHHSSLAAAALGPDKASGHALRAGEDDLAVPAKRPSTLAGVPTAALSRLRPSGT